MQKSRYTEEQIVGILKESEAGLPTAELCRKHGISEQTFLPLEGEVRRAGSERGAAAPATGRREPQAEAVGGRAGAGHRRLQGGAIKKVVSPQARREAVEVFRAATECSERHACGQLEVLRAMLRYRRRETRFAEANDRLRVRLRELAEDRRRWGYRRLHVLLKREGWMVNSKRVYRIYVEEKLIVRRRKRRRRICAQARVLLAAPVCNNETWTMDFSTGCIGLRPQGAHDVDRRRLHTGDAGHRGRYLIAGAARSQSAGEASARTWIAGADRHRPWHRVHLQGRWTSGPTRTRSHCTSSRLDGRWRTATSKASMENSARNA